MKPIYWALLLTLVPGFLLTGLYFLAQSLLKPKEMPTVVVEASYPGASAQDVARIVAAPIEQQVNGVEQMVSMWSRCRNDGTYTLTVSFKPGTDMNMAQVLVQNRVSLAVPILPELVKQNGVAVKKQSSDAVLLVALSSPDGRFDEIYLGNYAAIQLRDEMGRVAGVSDVLLTGRQEMRVRIFLDREKLAFHNMTAADVVVALKENNVGFDRVEAILDANLVLKMRGRLTDLESIQDTLLKADKEGRGVRLRDVARLELANQAHGTARRNGKPAAVLAVFALPGASLSELVAAMQDTLKLLEGHLPNGLALEVAFDFTAQPECVRVDLDLPPAASTERTLEAAKQCEAAARDVAGVKDTLILSGSPFLQRENQACILFRLAGKKKKDVIPAIRDALDGATREAATRICDLSGAKGFTTGGYPIEFVIQDRDDSGGHRRVTEKLDERLRQNSKLTDVWSTSTTSPELCLEIDSNEARARGVSVADVFDTLRVTLGNMYVNDFNRSGRTWQVRLQSDGAPKVADSLKQLKVRNHAGEMVPLGSIASVRAVEGLSVVERVNLYPSLRITANPATGVSIAETRAFCEAEFEAIRKELGLAKACHLVWMQGPQEAR
jgi:multidrug efflux pump subunit AcrB